MALPMFASDITFGGDVTTGVLWDFGEYVDVKEDYTFDIMAAIDDNNSLTVNVDGGENLALGGISKILVATDVAGVLGLPVGLTVSWGYDDPDWNAFNDVTSYGNTSYFLSPAEYWGMDFLLSVSMLEVELAFRPDLGAGSAGYLLVGAAVKEPIAGLNAEFYYFQNEAADFADGVIAFDASYVAEFGGFGVTVAPLFDMDMGADTWGWALNLVGSYDMFAVDAGVSGNDVDFLAAVDAAVWISPIDLLDIYAGMMLDFVAADAFQGADIGAKVHMGATNMFVGYNITENGAGEINGYFTAPDGGFYVAFDTNY